MPNYTTTELLASIKRRGQIPTSQNTFSTADMLAIADEEIRVEVLPLVMTLRESYYETYSDITIVSGQTAYDIPERAVGFKVKDIVVRSTNGDERSLSRIDSEVRGEDSSGSDISSFYFEGNKIVLTQTPASSNGDSLRVRYFIRPSSLILPSAAASITAIDTATNTVTVSSLPSTISTATPVDLVKKKPNFQVHTADATISSILSLDVTFSASLPDDLVVGDYLCLAGESPVIQVPVELQPLLAQKVAVTILRGLGHREELKDAKDELESMRGLARDLLNPRIDGEPKKIIPRNGILNPSGQKNWFNRY